MLANCHVGELSCWRIVMLANCHVGKLSCWRNVMVASCKLVNCNVGELSCWRIVNWQIVRAPFQQPFKKASTFSHRGDYFVMTVIKCKNTKVSL
jgi:hypothetical protein